MEKYSNINPSFKGLTKIYAIADTHQETRKTAAFLSKVLKDSIKEKNVLLLHSGDIYKGIYPRELERDCYVKMKEANPDLEMVMTIGNNDFGFNAEGFNYLVDTIKEFYSKGIRTVCANIFETTGKRPSWLKPYTIVERDGDRNFITGFCIDKLGNQGQNGIVPKNQKEVIEELIQAIKREKPDNVIILNHDYMPSSQELVKYCKDRGINVDVVIGGHDHFPVMPDNELHIYHPKAYAESMYKMNLVNKNGKKSLKDVEVINNENLELSDNFSKSIETYEKESGLLDNIGVRTLNLTKDYSNPCPLGSFLADNMKETANADIGFFSTGFILRPLKYEKGVGITNYDFKKTMVAETPIKTVELTTAEIKEVFDNALRNRGYGSSNPKFLQCSNNIKIIGQDNPVQQCYEIKQILIDGKPILDSNGTPIITSKRYKCVMDSYISEGGQGFTTLKEKEKQNVIIDNHIVKINEVLQKALEDAPKKYSEGSEYPNYIIENV